MTDAPADKTLSQQRVEQIRGLLRTGTTPGDIRRMLSVKWGIGTRAVQRYVRLALARNRESIGLSEDDALAQSVSYWSRKLQENENATQGAVRNIAIAEGTLYGRGDVPGLEAELQRMRDTPAQQRNKQWTEQYRTLMTDRKALLRTLEHNRKSKYTTEKEAFYCRERLDQLLGCESLRQNRQVASGLSGALETLSEPQRLAEMQKLGIAPIQPVAMLEGPVIDVEASVNPEPKDA